MIYFIVGAIALSIFGYAKFRSVSKGLRVLMYHKVSDQEKADDLSITAHQLKKHFEYFNKNKFTTILLSDLLGHILRGEPLPRKPLLLTFDDGYRNNYTELYPLLQKYGLKANIFLIAGFIRAGNLDIATHSEFLHVDQIQAISKETIQFGLHTYDHKSYADLTIAEIDEDLKRSRDCLERLKIPYQPCLAYTYGAYPKSDTRKRMAMFNVLKSNGVEMAMRIGNRINPLPLRNKFLIERIDMKGSDSFLKFKISLAVGRKVFFK
jgi:peptidoglycan/xylan/chitin deacetylase (PgdA/CDA1 family)